MRSMCRHVARLAQETVGRPPDCPTLDRVSPARMEANRLFFIEFPCVEVNRRFSRKSRRIDSPEKTVLHQMGAPAKPRKGKGALRARSPLHVENREFVHRESRHHAAGTRHAGTRHCTRTACMVKGAVFLQLCFSSGIPPRLHRHAGSKA